MNFLIGSKINMGQYFDEASGEVIPVTVIKAGSMVVTQVKTKAKDNITPSKLEWAKSPPEADQPRAEIKYLNLYRDT